MKNLERDPLNSKNVAQKLTIFLGISEQNQVKYEVVKFKITPS